MSKNECGAMEEKGEKGKPGKTVPGKPVPPSKKRGKGDIGAYLRMKKNKGSSPPPTKDGEF